MALKYAQVPANLYKEIAFGSGMLCESFDVETFVASSPICGTSGGFTLEATRSYIDIGAGIDNMPENTMENKRIETTKYGFNTTAVSAGPEMIKTALGAADIEELSNGVIKITPRPDIKSGDFKNLWWIVDYSDINTGEKAGFMAFHYRNTFTTSGLSLKSTNKDKATFDLKFEAHYSIENINDEPFTAYMFKGGNKITPLVVTSAPGETSGTTTITVSPEKAAGNKYYYKINAVTAPNVQPGDDVSSWNEWNGTSDITATDGYKITVVEADSSGKAVKSGNTIIQSAD